MIGVEFTKDEVRAMVKEAIGEIGLGSENIFDGVYQRLLQDSSKVRQACHDDKSYPSDALSTNETEQI